MEVLYMYYARRNGAFFPSKRKSYKKARWIKAYEREANRVKMLFMRKAFGMK